MRKVLKEVLNATGNYSPNATELLISSCVCPLVSLFDRLFHKENIGWDDSSLSHEHSLISCLREVFEDPSIELAVFHLNTFYQKADHHIIFELSSISFHVLSKLITLS
jgi:hypothetical protein